jgi:uncharacterized protein (DUF1330 family)
MRKAYIVASYRSVSDPAALAAYSERSGPAVRKAGGRILARGMPAKVLEAGLNQRLVLIEFDSLDQAVAAFQSEDYRKALDVLGSAAERDIRIIEAAE